MKQNLKYKKEKAFEKLHKTVEQCRNSGQKVSVWCKKNGIPIYTYYGR